MKYFPRFQFQDSTNLSRSKIEGFKNVQGCSPGQYNIAVFSNCKTLNSVSSLPGWLLGWLIPGILVIASASVIAESPAPVNVPIPEYSVVVDAGHGGAIVHRRDDRWDPISRKYLSSYLTGTRYTKYTEHELMLQLALRVHHYLQLTQTDAGWKKFEELLAQFSPQEKFIRIKFNSHLSRKDGWKDRSLPDSHPDVNAPYRLYDYPDRKTGRIQKGRISQINDKEPYLVLSLHLNPAPPKHSGGMAAVLAPGWETFNMLREVSLKQKPASAFYKSPWAKHWLSTEPGWSKLQAARADAWVYMNGYWSNKSGTAPWYKKARGFRHNLFQWRYADPPGWEKTALKERKSPGPYSMIYSKWRPEGRFWDRERSKAELWRREAAVSGSGISYGGDNHLASNELMRFIQFGVRQQVPEKRPSNKLGPILDPFVSTYTLPTYTNAIVAFLEVGHLNVWRDRRMVIDQREEVAISLAVGIYSLFAGLELKKPGYGPYRPRGRKLDFAKYETLPGGNYFKIVDDR